MGSKGTKFAVSIAIQARDMATRVVRGVASGLSRAFAGVTASVKRMVGSFRSIVDFGAKLGTVFATWGSWLGSLAGKIKDVVMETSEFGGRIADISNKTGIGTDALQEFAFAASQTGVETEKFLKSTEVMSRKFGEMHAGSKTLYTFLSTVGGKALADQAKGAKTMEARLELMLVAMSKITDEEKRLAFATQVFGEEGRDMALMVTDGTERLRELREEAHKYNTVLDREAIAGTEAFGDELDKLDKSWTGIKRIFGAEVIRGLLPEIQKLTQWLRENPESIRKMARELAGGVVSAVTAVRDGIAWIWAHRGDILDWAKALAAIFGAGALLGSIGGIISGLKTIKALAAGGAAAGPAGGAASIVCTVGWAASAGAVAGPAAAALFLSPSDMEQSSQTDAERIAKNRWGAGLGVLGIGVGNVNRGGKFSGQAGLPYIDPLLFAENRANDRAIYESFARIGAAVDVARAGGSGPYINRAVEDFKVKIFLDGPGAQSARVTETSGAATVEKRVGVRTAGSTP